MKKIKRILVTTGLALFVLGCSKDDAPKTQNPEPIGNPDPNPKPENRPPGSFSLLTVHNNATDVDVLPELSWEAATDPDGDPVTYDIYLGAEKSTLSPIAMNLGTTSFKLDDMLLRNTEYFWKVLAKDNNGATTLTEVRNFTVAPLPYLSKYSVELSNQEETIKEEYQFTFDSLNIMNNMQITFNGLVGNEGSWESMEYDGDGRLISFNIGSGDAKETRELSYDSAGKMIQLRRKNEDYNDITTTIFYDTKNRVFTTELESRGYTYRKTTYSYTGDADLPSSYTVVDSQENTEVKDVLHRKTLVWDENDNLVKDTYEINRSDGEGFKLKEEITFAYDAMKNPWSRIVDEKFVFNGFYGGIYGPVYLGLVFPSFSGELIRPLKNNLTQRTMVVRSSTGISINTLRFQHEYNESGYPISSTLQDSQGNITGLVTYSYEDD
ncbi:hypothetical protein [Maribacter sp. 2210JD10-5]|uniref:hypothetical protein n=1 Tax=Maribacter sp. 2210JD10-5 TaxID=3386272 RepID=UPI0039BD62C9